MIHRRYIRFDAKEDNSPPIAKVGKEVSKSALNNVIEKIGRSRVRLSAWIEDIIQFKAQDDEKRARYSAAAGGISGALTGGGLGAYIGAAHPETLTTYTGEVAKKMGERFNEGLEGLRDSHGEGWKNVSHPGAFGTGRFTPDERDARLEMFKHNLLKKRAIRRVGKYSAIGALGLGSLGAIGGYAASKGRPNEKKLSALLDDIINFGEDPRPRNLQGEFQPPGEGGPNPNAMATVYKQPQQQQQGVSVGKAAGAALAGGALGAVGSSAGKEGYSKTRRLIKRLARKARAPRI